MLRTLDQFLQRRARRHVEYTAQHVPHDPQYVDYNNATYALFVAPTNAP